MFYFFRPGPRKQDLFWGVNYGFIEHRKGFRRILGKGPLLVLLLLVVTTAVESIHRSMDTLQRPSIGTPSIRSQGCIVCYSFSYFFFFPP